MSKPDTPEIDGCSDHGCVFGHPGGMGTNGGCRCLKTFISTNPVNGRRVHKNIRLLRAEIKRLRELLPPDSSCKHEEPSKSSPV